MSKGWTCRLCACSYVGCSASQSHHFEVISPLHWSLGRHQVLARSASSATVHPQYVAPRGTVAGRSRSLAQQHRGSYVQHPGASSRIPFCRVRWLLASPYLRGVGSSRGVWTDGKAPVGHSMWDPSALVCSALYTLLPCMVRNSASGHTFSELEVWLQKETEVRKGLRRLPDRRWLVVWASESGSVVRSLQGEVCRTTVDPYEGQFERVLQARRSACQRVAEADSPILRRLVGGLAVTVSAMCVVSLLFPQSNQQRLTAWKLVKVVEDVLE